MSLLKINKSLLGIYILAMGICVGCSQKETVKEFFPGKYPGTPKAAINKKSITLSNNAIKAEWGLVNNSVVLKSITNKYDNESIDLSRFTLFAVTLEDGKTLTNKDFTTHDALQVKKLTPTDTLPSLALRYGGKEIKCKFTSKEPSLSIDWTAQLREGSNYIRQNITISTHNKPVKVTKVVFFDGTLKGAKYAGSVLGSPIIYNNFFFGLEHPIAQSKALYMGNMGSIAQKSIDATQFINSSGKYVISIEHGGGAANYNINAIALLDGKDKICSDDHPLNGLNGSSLYHLEVKNYKADRKYTINCDIENINAATGTIHIYKKSDNILNFYVERTDELSINKHISEWSVIGVSPEGQNRRAFQYYIQRERARPYKQFLHYNCWWDITDDGASSFTSEQLLERMDAWNKKFIEPYNIELNSFVFDDGWDDLNHVWHFDPVKFPTGFAPEAELCKKYNSGIGVWMSPFGGYLENKQRRIETAKREGLEVNDKGLSLAGTNYYNRFLERALDMLDNYNVNYFKFDGFGGSEPQYLPDMEAGAQLIKTLRKHNPDVFVNITVGSWPSPFWLKYADCTWRGSGDAHMAGKGTRTQKFMTYRDGTLHNNIVNRAPYYPLNSIMVAGIAYANLGHPIKCINDSISDFKDMVRSFFGAGSSLQELYISHDRMKPEFWPILAEAAHWAKANQNILKDVHWVGGSPINLQVYGFASWTPEKGIITLRNPGDKTVAYELNLDKILELPSEYRSEFKLHSPWKEDSSDADIIANSSKPCIIELQPFETKVLEITPR